jgi:hypothetical protein
LLRGRYLGGEGGDGGVSALGEEEDAVEPVEHGVACLAVMFKERVLEGPRELILLFDVFATCACGVVSDGPVRGAHAQGGLRWRR